MASFASQRCTSVSARLSSRAKALPVPARAVVSRVHVQRQHIRVRSGLSDMLDVGRGERKALLHTFYHDFNDQQKLVSHPGPHLDSLALHCCHIGLANAMHGCLMGGKHRHTVTLHVHWLEASCVLCDT